jgi:hypothetical protein
LIDVVIAAAYRGDIRHTLHQIVNEKGDWPEERKGGMPRDDAY